MNSPYKALLFKQGRVNSRGDGGGAEKQSGREKERGGEWWVIKEGKVRIKKTWLLTDPRRDLSQGKAAQTKAGVVFGGGQMNCHSTDPEESVAALGNTRYLTLILWPTSTWRKRPGDDSSPLSPGLAQALSMGHHMAGWGLMPRTHEQIRELKQKENGANFCPSDPGHRKHQGVISFFFYLP